MKELPTARTDGHTLPGIGCCTHIDVTGIHSNLSGHAHRSGACGCCWLGDDVAVELDIRFAKNTEFIGPYKFIKIR